MSIVSSTALLRYYLRDRKREVPQFLPSTTLIQHMGTASSIFGYRRPTTRRFHRAPSFPCFEKWATRAARTAGGA
jgi:hypothetical protein